MLSCHGIFDHVSYNAHTAVHEAVVNWSCSLLHFWYFYYLFLSFICILLAWSLQIDFFIVIEVKSSFFFSTSGLRIIKPYFLWFCSKFARRTSDTSLVKDWDIRPGSRSKQSRDLLVDGKKLVIRQPTKKNKRSGAKRALLSQFYSYQSSELEKFQAKIKIAGFTFYESHPSFTTLHDVVVHMCILQM